MAAERDDMIEFECEECGSYVVIYDPLGLTVTQPLEYFRLCAECREMTPSEMYGLPPQWLVQPIYLEK